MIRSLRPCALVGWWLACAAPVPGQSPSPAPADDSAVPPLAPLVEAYFKADSDRARRGAIAAIRAAEGVTFADVAAALPRVQVWEKHDAGGERVEVRTPRRSSRLPHLTVLQVRVPAGYDPAKAYPLLIGIPNVGRDAEQFTAFLVTLMGKRADEFIIAGTSDLEGLWLTDPAEAAGDPCAVLAELRRRYHVDTDRVLLTGYRQGGHAACTLAVLCPDPFAAVLPLAGTLALDVDAAAVDLFLPNIAHLPITLVYGGRDVEESHPSPDETVVGGVAAWNRYLAARTGKLNLPLKTIEIPDAGSNGIAPTADVLNAFLDSRRAAPSRQVSLRFRYLEQGRTGWLRMSRYQGEPWTAQQIAISPAATESAGEAVTAVLREKLAYLGGSIEGQTIRIETHRCERVEVLLSDELVDLDEDVTVFLDGTQKFSGKVERRLETLLEFARTEWEFQRPVAARLVVSRSGRTIQD